MLAFITIIVVIIIITVISIIIVIIISTVIVIIIIICFLFIRKKELIVLCFSQPFKIDFLKIILLVPCIYFLKSIFSNEVKNSSKKRESFMWFPFFRIHSFILQENES